MPFTIDQLKAEHDRFVQLNPDRKIDLPTFAKAADELYGTPGERSVGYNWGITSEINQRINDLVSPVAGVTKMIGETGGSLLDSQFGTGDRLKETLGSVGEGLPRFAGEAALTAIPVIGQAGRGLQLASLLAKGAGYGSAYVRGTAEHNSPVSGVIEAASLGAGNVLLPKLDKLAVEAVNKKLYGKLGQTLEGAASEGADQLASVLASQTTSQAIGANVARTAARVAAGGVGGSALGEVTRQAQLTVDGAPLSERNPFTLENIVGNVAGAVGFAPIQIMEGLRRPTIDLTRAAEVSRWAKETGRIETPEVRKKVASDAFGSALDQYLGSKQAGDTASMEDAVSRMNAATRLSERPDGIKFMADTADLYNEAKAKGVMPADLKTFVESVNQLIDERNLASSADAKDAAFFGREADPVGPSSAAVKQLQEKNYLPKIDEKFIRESFQKHLERSLNQDPVFGYRAMVEEVSNRLLSMYDDAKVRMEQDATKASTQAAVQNKGLAKEMGTERQYYDALAKVKEMEVNGIVQKDFVQALISRHLEIANRIGKSMEGIEGSGYDSWRAAVIEAVDNFDPETGKTVLTFGNKKKGELVTKDIKLTDLTRQRADGGYVINPKFRRFRKAQGGRSTLEQADVGFTNESPTPSDIAQSQVYEDLKDSPVQWVDEGVTKGDSGDAVPVEDKIPADFALPLNSSVENPAVTKLKEITSTWTDQDVFKKLEAYLRAGRPQPIVERNQKYAKQAFNAIIELRGDKAYLSKETIDFAKAINKNFDKIAAKSGEREAVRDSVRTFWDSSVEKLWKTFRPGEEIPSDVRRYEPVLEKLLGPDAIREIKMQSVDEGHGIGVAVKPNRAGLFPDQTNRDFDIGKAYKKFFYEQGYDPVLADHFTSIALRMSKAFGDVKFGFSTIRGDDPIGYKKLEVMDKTIENLRIAGIYAQNFFASDTFRNSPLIAIALEHSKGKKDPYTSAFMLSVLAHEIVHGVEFQKIEGSGPYFEERKAAWNGMHKIVEGMTAAERLTLINTIADATFPLWNKDANSPFGASNEFFKKLEGFTKIAALDPIETINMYAQFLALGKLSPSEIKVQDITRWMPDEVINFTKGFYRDLSDLGGAIAEHSMIPEAKEIHDFANKLMKVPDFDRAKREAGIVLANLSGYPQDFATSSKFGVWRQDPLGYFFTSPKFMADASTLNETAVGEGKKFFWQEKDGVRIGKLSYLMPFFQLLDKLQKRGVTLAGDVWNALADVQPGYSRIQARVMSPLLLRDARGKWSFDNDNPMLKLATASQKDPKAMAARNALNEILQWQQDNGSILAVRRTLNGLEPTREAAPWLNERIKSVPVEWRQALYGSVEAMNRVYGQAKGVLYDSQVSNASYRVALLVQTISPTMPYDMALSTARVLTQAALEAASDVTNPQIPPVQKFLQRAGNVDPKIVELTSRYFFDSEGIAPKIVELKKFLDERPGFASEQRPGRFLIESKNSDGKREVDGAETKAHADLIIKRLTAKGNKIVDVVDKTDLAKLTNFDAPDTVYEKAIAAEQANWEGFLTRAEKFMRPDQIQVLKEEYVPGEKLAKELSVKGVGKFTTERKFVGGRERLDRIDAMRGYVQGLAGSVSRQETRNLMRLILNDVRLDKEVDFKARALQQLDWVMTPDSELATKVKTGLAAYYLGGNLSSMLIEGTQSAVTLVPQLLAQGGRGYGLGSAWKTVASSAVEAWGLGSSDSHSVYTVAAEKIRKGVKLTPEEERTYWFRKALDDGILDHGAIEDVYDRDQRALMARKFGHGDYGDTTMTNLVGNKVYQGSQLLLWAYGKVSNFNQKLSFVAGLKQGQELGLQGEKLYEHARRTKDLSMFGGGKANQPGVLSIMSNPYTKSTLGVMYTLQQYGLGMTAHLFERARESFSTSTSLTPVQKMQARKAFATMAGTQLALAGALGLPFVGAGLAALEKVFGINANAAVREGLASLAGDDQELGSLISELALDGIASHTLGLDIGSRVGVSNLLGTSAYRGFSFQDLLGPVPSVLTSLMNGVSEASQGNVWEGARQLVPQTFKNLVGMQASQAKYGDLAFRDKSSNLLYEPTTKEAAMYAIGFRPRELAQKQKLQSLLKTSDELYQKSNDATLDTIARSLRTGDSGPLEKFLNDQRLQDPMLDEKTLVASVVNRAVNMDVPVDPLASGARGNQDRRRAIAGTFDPSIVDRRDEVTKALRADELNATTGYQGGKPLAPRELMKALMLDDLTAKGLTRNQALRELEVMGFR